MLNIPEEIKQKLLEGCNKNFRVHFPNGEHSDITNENIVSESVSFTESICSQSELKFGLCESPYIEFETFGIGKIKGCEIECSLEIPTTRNVEQIAISDYYDYPTSGKFAAGDVVKIDLMKPIADAVVRVRGWLVNQNMQTDDNQVFYITWTDDMNKTSPYGQSTQIVIEDVGTTLASVIVDTVYPIPLGRFVVDSCKKQADMTHRRIIAYGITEIIRESNSDNSNSQRLFKYNTDYKYDPIRRIFTYFNNVDASSISTLEELEISEERDIIRTMVGNSEYSISVQGMKVPTNLFESNPNELYLIKSDALTNVDTVIENTLNEFRSIVGREITKLEKNDIESFVRRYCGNVIFLKGKTEYIETFPEEQFYFYPYMPKQSGETDQGSIPFAMFAFGFKRILTNVGSDITFRDKTKIHYYKVSSNYFGILETTEKRTKVKVGSTTYYQWLNTWKAEDALKYVEAFCELMGMFGKAGRDGKMRFISLSERFSALYPSETLYPSDDLFPSSVNGGTLQKSSYQNIWYDDDYVLPYANVRIDIVDSNDTHTIHTYHIESKIEVPNNNKTYDLSENAIIKKSTFLGSVETLLEYFGNNVASISYMPSEIEMQGRPDLEAGDVLEIATTDETITTIILSRTMNGIQALFDSIKSD